MAANSNNLNRQGIWIGAGVTSMNDSALFLPGQLGMFFEKAGQKYQLVKFASTTGTIAAGTPVLWSDRDDFVVSSTVADSKRNEPAGIALGTVTAGNYGFIQVRGNHATVLTNGDDDIAQGDAVIMSSSDGVVDSTAAGTAATYNVFGYASAADVDANNTVAVNLTVALNGA